MKKNLRLFIILFLGCLAVVIMMWPRADPSGPSPRLLNADQPKKPVITIGSKSITEQYLLMKMTSIVLREHGFDVNEMVFLDSPAIRSSMEAGVVDQYWEYTTTARLFYHKKSPIYDPDAAFMEVANEDRKKGITWLPRSEFNSSWTLMMRSDLAKRLNIDSISHLSEYMKKNHANLKIATNDEYLHREDGLQRLQDIYGFTLQKGQIIAIDSDLLSQAVKESRVQVAVGMASDPKIKEDHLTVLKDDKQAFPPYHAAPVVLSKTLREHPEIASYLEQIRSQITQSNMLDLIYQVDILQKDVTTTARDFLIKQRIIKP